MSDDNEGIALVSAEMFEEKIKMLSDIASDRTDDIIS